MYIAYEKAPISLIPRAIGILIVFALCFLVLAMRIWYLQAIKGEYYALQSENNRQRTVFVPPPRGLIKDRNGEVIAKNRPAFNIEIYVNETPNVDETIRSLAETIKVPYEQLKERYDKQPGARFRPRILVRDASKKMVARVAARRNSLPGISINHYPTRHYIYGDVAAHVIGHIREISAKELADPNFKSYYKAGDLIGKYGLELRWERYLQGTRGRKQFIVNAHGVKIHDLPDGEPSRPGNALELTIDKDIQMAADKALKEHWGAVVALDVNSGAVLALSSAPTFDPNAFTGEMSVAEWRDLLSGKENRLSNRAVQGDFPPGSVFKAIMAAAGLAEGIITPNSTESCSGRHRFGNRTFHCHKRSGHGTVNLEHALAESCDIYFYILGQRLGIDRIYDYSYRFGLDRLTGLDLVHESSGLIPSTAWKKKRFAGTPNDRWFPGETLSVSIGQGAALTTPLQLAVAYSAIANGGKVYKPYLVSRVLSGNASQVLEKSEPHLVSEVQIPDALLAEVRKGLLSVVNAPFGTARRAKLPEDWGIISAGKTGTSQVVALSKKGKGKDTEHHAWFVGYAPADKPEIAVAALIEHGGSGGTVAAPVVRKVMEAYFVKSRGFEPIPEEEKK